MIRLIPHLPQLKTVRKTTWFLDHLYNKIPEIHPREPISLKRNMKMHIAFPILLSCLLLQACSSHSVKGRVWTIESIQSSPLRTFPELDPDLIPNRLASVYEQGTKSGRTTGVVFSGGGTRSASLTLGQLRALHELDVLGSVHYISAVSGGSWASVPFTYASCSKERKASDCTDADYTETEMFLGKYIPPDELTEQDLRGTDSTGDLGKAITRTFLLLETLSGWLTLKMDETYAHAIGSKFLEPFDLNEHRFFSSDEKTLMSILADNQSLDRNDFYIPLEDKPYLIVGATVQTVGFFPKPRRPDDIFPLEITPLYVGVPTTRIALGTESRRIGGGYIEPLMYNSMPPDSYTDIYTDKERRTEVRISNNLNRFSLSDVIGTSGAAPQEALGGYLRSLLVLTNMGLPELHHWPVTQNSPYQPKKTDYVHGDGGNIDNIGIMPLLSRKVDNILVFVNTQEDFDSGYESEIPAYAMYSDLQDYFKFNPERPKNVVFEEQKLYELYRAFEADKLLGLPLVHCDTYAVKENPFFGVDGDNTYTPNICWVYNSKPNKWVDLLTDKLGGELDKIYNSRPPYKNIPHSRTFFQQWHVLNAINRNTRHVNIESNISSWSLCESADEVFRIGFQMAVEPRDGSRCGASGTFQSARPGN